MLARAYNQKASTNIVNTGFLWRWRESKIADFKGFKQHQLQNYTQEYTKNNKLTSFRIELDHLKASPAPRHEQKINSAALHPELLFPAGVKTLKQCSRCSPRSLRRWW